MKTLRLFGLTLMAVLLSVNFTSCSDDDEPIAMEQLEGTWIMTRHRYEYIEKDDNRKDSGDDKFDASKEEDGMMKFEIKKTGENTYQVEEFEYYTSSGSENWHSYGIETYELKGNRLVDPDDTDDYYDIRSLNSTTLVLYTEFEDQDDKDFDEITLQKK